MSGNPQRETESDVVVNRCGGDDSVSGHNVVHDEIHELSVIAEAIRPVEEDSHVLIFAGGIGVFCDIPTIGVIEHPTVTHLDSLHGNYIRGYVAKSYLFEKTKVGILFENNQVRKFQDMGIGIESCFIGCGVVH